MANLYVDNAMKITVSGLVDQDGNVVDNATVEVVIYDSGGNEVSGQTWPLTLSDDGGGDYSGLIDSSVDIVIGENYTIELTATRGNAKATWKERMGARQRTFDK